MNTEYINAYGYFLLTLNIITLIICIASAIYWAAICMNEDIKPKFFSFMMLMLAASLVFIIANTTALGRMFDSFLIVKMHINKGIIQTTIVDRFAMGTGFLLLFFAAVFFKRACCTDKAIKTE